MCCSVQLPPEGYRYPWHAEGLTLRHFERLYARDFMGELGSGSTKPCVLACEDAEGRDAGEYATKLRGQVRAGGLCFEFVAAHLAEHFDLPMPEAALVEIGDDLPVPGNPAAETRVRNSAGLNFGTRYLTPGYNTWPIGERVGEGLRQAALEIVAFDALIENPDRRRDKPNVLWRGEELYIFDHELAFGFVHGLMGMNENTPRPNRLAFLRDHIFHASLRGRDDLDLTRFVGRLAELTDDALAEILEATPDEFGGDHLEAIGQHVRRARDEGHNFGNAVKGALL